MIYLADPNVAIPVILAGIFLIYAECNRPGTIFLGCSGTLAVMLGIYGLALPPIRPLRPSVAFATGTLFVLVTLPLARIALCARRNKRIVRKPAPNLQPSATHTPE